MPKTKIVVDYDEIFCYAKEKHNIEWNDCCDMFHRKSILCDDEGKNRTIYLEELRDYSNKKDPIKIKGWEIVKEYMEENKLKEMYVDND